MSFWKTVGAAVLGGLIVALVGGAVVAWTRRSISGVITPSQAGEPVPKRTGGLPV